MAKSTCCLTLSSSEQKTKYLPHAVPYNTSSNTNSQSRLQKEKKKEKRISYCVNIYLTNVKGTFLFMCVFCEHKAFFIYYILISLSVNEWWTGFCDFPCLCEMCVSG